VPQIKGVDIPIETIKIHISHSSKVNSSGGGRLLSHPIFWSQGCNPL